MKTKTIFYVLFIFSFLIYFPGNAQSNLNDEGIIASEIQTYTELANSDPKLAVEKLIKLRNKLKMPEKSEDYKKINHEIIRIYMNILSDFSKAIEETKLGEKIAQNTKDYAYLAKMHQIRGISYIRLGLSEQGLHELENALEYIQKTPDSPSKYMTISIIYDNIGGYYETKQNFEEFEKYKRKSLSEVYKIEESTKSDRENKYTMIASQYINLGFIKFSNKKLDSAEFYFTESYKIIEANKDIIPMRIQADIRNRMSWLYFEKKDFENSIRYAREGVGLLEKNPNSEVKKSLYQILFLSFLETKQIDSSKLYSDLFLKLNDSIAVADKSSTNSEMKEILKDNESYYHNNFFKTVVFLILLSAFIVLGIYLRTIRYRKKYLSLLDRIKTEKKESTDHILLEDVAESAPKNNHLMTNETKKTLIKKIEKFEKTNKFTRGGLTLITLAHEMNTNTTYLSMVIKEMRNKNFNNYLNGLRIEYIINLLHNEPRYREYKTSYLAEICGFSSREVFTTVFKKETGISPSYFIENLKKDDIGKA